MSISLNMQGVYRNNKKMSIGAHNDKGSRFNKSDYEHIYNMYKLYMNDKLNKFKKVTVTGYDDGHKLFTCILTPPIILILYLCLFYSYNIFYWA